MQAGFGGIGLSETEHTSQGTGSRVLVLGLGASGVAAADLALHQGQRVTVLDVADSAELRDRAANLRERGAVVCLDWREGTDLPETDLVVISPGISPSSSLGLAARRAGCPVVSELEFGYRACCCPVLAVTGTNGKTTTVELTVHCLRHAGYSVLAAGNIGLPLSEAALRSASLDFLVVEVSSFQLTHVDRFAPLGVALLNIAADHLDWHGTVDDYVAAKARILTCAARGGTVVLQRELADNPVIAARLAGVPPQRLVLFSAHDSAAPFHAADGRLTCDGTSWLDVRELCLQGRHNVENVLAALALCRIAGVDPGQAVGALPAFHPGRHRLELVAFHHGVRYVNDSKATNPDALRAALETLAPPGTAPRILLIAGGLDKGLDLGEVVPDLVHRVKEVFLIGTCRARLAKLWNPVVSCKVFVSLDAAVDAAAERAEEGDVVLLSPACASQDMFRDYAQRGNAFCESVRRRVGP
jgi:UDP-N-acetylmuramoylalanine--D-glutamate ligase